MSKCYFSFSFVSFHFFIKNVIKAAKNLFLLNEKNGFEPSGQFYSVPILLLFNFLVKFWKKGGCEETLDWFLIVFDGLFVECFSFSLLFFSIFSCTTTISLWLELYFRTVGPNDAEWKFRSLIVQSKHAFQKGWN